MQLRPWYPFVDVLDAGHPPLVSWCLGLLFWLPVPRLMAFHLLSWAAAATLVSATFEIGRRHFGLGVGLSAALLTAVHPVVAAQALQLNLDLYVAAFTMLALLGAARGSPVLTGIGCVGATFSKLNGIFVLAPVTLWLVARWALEPKRAPRALFSALLPVGVTAALFAGYHAAKLRLTGHLFATAESADANLTFVASGGEYVERLKHAAHQVFGFNNPSLWALAVLVVAAALVGLRAIRSRSFGELWRGPGMGAGALLVLLFASQLGLWSLRRYPALVRYFMVVQPALYLVACAVLARALGRFTRIGLPLVAATLVLAFVAAWSPAYRRQLPARLAESLALPPAEIDTNHENSLDLVDQLETFRQAVARLDALAKAAPRAPTVAVAWPYDAYLADPEHGMTPRRYEVRGLRPSPEADFALVTSSRDSTRSPFNVAPRGYRTVEAFVRRRAWTVLLERDPLDPALAH